MNLQTFQELESEKKHSEILQKYNDLEVENLSKKDFIRISCIVAKANFLLGNLEEAHSIAQEVIEWAKDYDKEILSSTLSLQANCYSAQGKFDKARNVFEYLFKEVNTLEELDSYPIIMANYGHTFFYSGKIMEAHEIYLRALEISKEKDVPNDSILNSLALTNNQLGEYRKAIELVEEAIKQKEESNNWNGWVIAKVNAGRFYSNIGRFTEAHEAVDQALKYSEEKTLKREMAGAHSEKGAILIKEKKIFDAYDHLNVARAILEKSGIKDILPEIYLRLGFVTFLMEKYSETEIIIQRLTKLAEEKESYFYLIWSTSLEALLNFEKEKSEEAFELIETALELALEFNLYSIYFQTTSLASYFYILGEKNELLEKNLKKILKIARKQKNKIETIKQIIALEFLYISKGETEKILEYEKELDKNIKDVELFSADRDVLGADLAELVSIDAEEMKKSVMNKAREHLIDFLRRITQLF